MRVKHIVLDIGGVLIDWDPEILFRQLIPEHARRSWFLTDVCSAAWNKEQDKGRSWAEAEAVLLPKYPEWEAEIRAYRARWIEMVPGPTPGGLELLSDLLNTGIALTGLSNWSRETFVETRRRFPALDRLAGITVSGEVGLAKPDLAIYRLHEILYELHPGSTLFIDDNPDNVLAAQACGWQAVVHSSAVATRAHLVARGPL
jgi:2-haloacid dehalogenase